jgi:hypothetical protein
VWLVLRGDLWLRFAGRPGRFAGFATFGHAHIRGLGTPRLLFVARPLSKVERGRRGGGCSGDESRSCVREPGSLGPPREP